MELVVGLYSSHGEWYGQYTTLTDLNVTYAPMKIPHLLEKQGFTPRKSKVYLAVLAQGKATTLSVARATHVKRTSVYDILLDLLREGYLSEVTIGKKRFFVPEDPTRLIQQSHERAFETKSLVAQLVPIFARSSSRPDVHFYEGALAMKNIMEDILQVKGKENRYWGSTADLIDLFGIGYTRKYVARRVKKGIWSIALLTQRRRIPPEISASDPKYLRKSVWLPRSIEFSGSLCLYDDKVAYISSEKESFGFIIKSKELSILLRQIFDTMWLMAETQAAT